MSQRPITYPPGTKKYFGTFVRGLVYQIGEGLPPLRFGDARSDRHFCILDMDKEIDRKRYEAAIKTKGYATTTEDARVIWHVDSPEEARRKIKEKEQKEKLKFYLDALASGLFRVHEDLNQKNTEQLIDLADQIGADYNYYCPKTKGMVNLRRSVILKNVREKLGIDKPEPDRETEVETEINKEVPDGENNKRVAKGRPQRKNRV